MKLIEIIQDLYLLGDLQRHRVRPQKLDVFPIVEDRDILSADLQPDPQLLVADSKTANVGVGVTPLNSFRLSNGLSIHNKT